MHLLRKSGLPPTAGLLRKPSPPKLCWAIPGKGISRLPWRREGGLWGAGEVGQAGAPLVTEPGVICPPWSTHQQTPRPGMHWEGAQLPSPLQRGMYTVCGKKERKTFNERKKEKHLIKERKENVYWPYKINK